MHKGVGSSGCAAAPLPPALLARVLQHVPQQQRLSQCALVCASWKSAAARATVHVDCDIKRDAVPALQSWLAVHAGQLLSIRVSVPGSLHPPTLQLPLDGLTKLQSLQLQGFILQLPGEDEESLDVGSSNNSKGGSSNNGSKGCIRDDSSSKGNSIKGSSQAGTLPMLPNVQLIELVFVQLGSVSSLLQLTKAPQLTSLVLSGIDVLDLKYTHMPLFQPNTRGAVQKVAGAVVTMVQQLPWLSRLLLLDLPFTDAAVQQTSAMQGLQQIALSHHNMLPACDIGRLPSSITQLQLSSSILVPSLPFELRQLSGLLELDLDCCSVPAAALGSLAQLRVLSMDGCDLLPDPYGNYDEFIDYE